MKIDFRKPRYVIPLILLPFLCIFFYVYKSSFGKEQPPQAGQDSLQTNLAHVSDQVRNRALSNKLDAYRNQYKQADGYTAIGHIQEEQTSSEVPNTLYNENERRMLDSIDKAMKGRYGTSPATTFPNAVTQVRNRDSEDAHDRALADALAMARQPADKPPAQPQPTQPDPIELFRKHTELVDSLYKANDTEYGAEQERLKQAERLENERKQNTTLSVSKADGNTAIFNTVTPDRKETFITAIVDQDIK